MYQHQTLTMKGNTSVTLWMSLHSWEELQFCNNFFRINIFHHHNSLWPFFSLCFKSPKPLWVVCIYLQQRLSTPLCLCKSLCVQSLPWHLPEQRHKSSLHVKLCIQPTAPSSAERRSSIDGFGRKPWGDHQLRALSSRSWQVRADWMLCCYTWQTEVRGM